MDGGEVCERIGELQLFRSVLLLGEPDQPLGQRLRFDLMLGLELGEELPVDRDPLGVVDREGGSDRERERHGHESA